MVQIQFGESQYGGFTAQDYCGTWFHEDTLTELFSKLYETYGTNYKIVGYNNYLTNEQYTIAG